MTFQKMTIGSVEFANVRMANPEWLAAIAASKNLNADRASITSFGSWGVVPWYFEAILSGATGKTDLWSIIGELEKKHAVRLKADIYGGVDAYGKVQSIRPVEYAAWTEDGNYNYPVRIVFLAAITSDKADRVIQYNPQDESDTFSITSDRIICMPVNASDLSETSDFSRYISDGAGSTYTIQCCMNPERSKSKIIYTMSTEADLDKGLVTITKSGNEHTLDNGHLRVVTCHDETAKGPLEVWYYNGTSWVDLGRLKFYLSESGGSGLVEITGGDGADVDPVFPDDPLRKSLRLIYPAEATDGNEGIVTVELEYGRPYAKIQLFSGDSTSKIACAYRLQLTPTDFTYWTHSATEVNAGAGAYGTPEVAAGDTDTVNASWVHTTTGAPAASTILAGWGRRKMADCDHAAYDAGNYWSYLEERFDNVTVAYGRYFEPAWLFAGRYDKIGSRTAAQLANECLVRLNQYNTVLPKV